jgi:hypothetical protein
MCLYYKPEPESDRWIPGDRFIRPWVRRLVRGRSRPGGVDRVFLNLCRGLDLIGREYVVNIPFAKIKTSDNVGVLGRGRHCLKGYESDHPIVAGIGLMTHPSEWPSLCDDYPVAKYLQHSEWAAALYRPYYGTRCALWPVGIDTAKWRPTQVTNKWTDFLVYDKIMWDYERQTVDFMRPILSELEERNLSFEIIRYGSYNSTQFQEALARCRGMIFLCEHESQGLAYQECLASGVPVLAWDQGRCLDPNRFKWGQPDIAASSVPFFDERCGLTFKDLNDFSVRLDEYMDRYAGGKFKPRDYILENLTLERCAENFVSLFSDV